MINGKDAPGAQPNMNDNNSKTSPPDLTAEQTDKLIALLREAYPSPGTDIHAAVMEKIKADEGARILPTADSTDKKQKRAKIMNRAVKWGALAACVAIVGAVGLRILPTYTKDAAMQESAASSMEMAKEEMAVVTAETAAPANENALYDAKAASPAEPVNADTPEEAFADEAFEMEAPAEEEAIPDNTPMLLTSFGGSGVTVEAPAEEAVEAAEEVEVEEAVAEMAVIEEKAAVEADDDTVAEAYSSADAVPDSAELPPLLADVMGRAANESLQAASGYEIRTDCEHASSFRNSYHDIPNALIERVGVSAFNEWAADAQDEDPCGVNILSFALRFGMSAEELYAVGDVWYYLDLPDDLELTAENAEAIAAYYENGGDREKMLTRYFAYELKNALIRESGISAYLAWRGEDSGLRSWTVDEFAADFGITDGRMAEIYDAVAEALAEELELAEVPAFETVKGY